MSELAKAIRHERKPRTDEDFRKSVYRLLGIRGARVTALSVGRFETNIDYGQWDRAVKRRNGDRFFDRTDDVFRRWAFGITRFTGGSVKYGSGYIDGHRDRKRIKEWMQARAQSRVAPR